MDDEECEFAVDLYNRCTDGRPRKPAAGPLASGCDPRGALLERTRSGCEQFARSSRVGARGAIDGNAFVLRANIDEAP